MVVRATAGGWRCLLLRAFGYWDFPKGLVEPGEDPRAAAIREVEEETGLAGLEFRWGEDFLETAPYAGGKVARYYLAESPAGEAALPVSPELGRPEHDEFRWASVRRGAAIARAARAADRRLGAGHGRTSLGEGDADQRLFSSSVASAIGALRGAVARC